MYLAELHAIYTTTDIAAWFLLQRILNIFLSSFGTWHSRTLMICIGGAVVAQWIILRTLNGEVPNSNRLAAAVVPLGKALYPHCLVPWKGFKAVGPLVACL